MRIETQKIERIVQALLFLAISALIFMRADVPDMETFVYYLAGSVMLWASVWFIYVLIRDAIIALRWKKPVFSLPQDEKEAAEMEKLREEMFINQLNDPYDPSFHPFDK